MMEVNNLQVETSKVYLRDTTVVSPYDLLLFGGDISVQHQVSLFLVSFGAGVATIRMIPEAGDA